MKRILSGLVWFGSINAMIDRTDYELSAKNRSIQYAKFLKAMSILEEQEEKESLADRRSIILPLITIPEKSFDKASPMSIATPPSQPKYNIWVEEDDTDFVMLNRSDFEDL